MMTAGVEVIVVGWFVSAVLSKLVNVLPEYWEKQTGLKEEVDSLEIYIPKIVSVVCAAEKRSIAFEENPGLKAWLCKLEVALHEAEDVLDELEYLRIEEESNKKIVLCVIKVSKRLFNWDSTLKRLKAVVKKLNEFGDRDIVPFLKIVKMEHTLIGNSRSSHNDLRSRGPGLTKKTPILGREEEREELINQLLCLESSCKPETEGEQVGVSVIPILGEGGLGKTTLAQLVINDDKVKRHFKPENIWWVTVSDDFVLDLVPKKIYNAVFNCESSVNCFDVIQSKLKTKLESTTFLLVLDDVWLDDKKRVSWTSQVMSLLEHGKPGSKILVTTRSESVARLVKTTSDPFRLTRLKEEAYWELFKVVCLPNPEDEAEHPELLDIGKKIAKKLNGSPLAAKVVGGMLNDKLDETYWKSIYETDMCNFDDIMSVLKMSYQHLPKYLQPLFRYCNIFPPDHKFHKEQMIYMWAGAGLILQEKDQEQDLDDLGRDYFEDLLRRSFFIDADPKNPDTNYVMHDLVHDLAQVVSAGECCRVSGDRSVDIPTTTKHLSVATENIIFFEKMPRLKHLRTLRLSFDDHFGKGAEGAAVLTKLFKTLTSIRVLDLPRHYEMNKKSKWIKNLKHLRYLRANVPIASLSSLYLLQYLIVLTPLGEPLSAEHLSFPRLRYFKCDGSCSVTSCFEMGAPGNLTMLRELNFRLDKVRGYKISELRKLVELRCLKIKALETVSGFNEAAAGDMKGKHHLKQLKLEWSSNSESTSEKVFDGLEPHVGLKEMYVKGYPGSRAPCWFQTFSLESKLEEISMDNCSNWKDLVFLQHLPSLMVLKIWNMGALEGIVLPFPKLRELQVSSCPMVKTLPPLPLGLKILHLYSVSLTTLPVQDNDTPWLSQLIIGECQNLISLRVGLLQENVKLNHLKEVIIKNCRDLVHLPDFGKLRSLEKLIIIKCSQITSLDLSGFTALKFLSISGCPALESVKGLENPVAVASPRLLIKNCPRLRPYTTLQQNSAT